MQTAYKASLCMAGCLTLAWPAAASYLIEPLSVMGNFTPVAITDDGFVVGTIVTDDGSLAMTTNGAVSKTFDFCGTQGALDNTVLTAASPYSEKRFLAGNCGYATGFVYDVARNTVTTIALALSPGTSVSAVGPAGRVAGIADEHSGGNTAFYSLPERYSQGHYSTFFPGEFATVSQITGAGMIVGYSINVGGSGSGFTLQPGGTPVLVQPPKMGPGNYVFLYGGNRQGQFVGMVVDSNKLRAAVWQAGRFEYARLPADTVSSSALAINEHGDVAGVLQDDTGIDRVFVWHLSTGQVELVATPDNVQDMSVVSINNRGDIAGTFTQSGARQAYRATSRP